MTLFISSLRWSFLIAVLLLGFVAGVPALAKAEEKKPESIYLLECFSLELNPAGRDADCHQAKIMLKKAFFEHFDPVRVTTNPGVVKRELPVMQTRILLYRQARLLPPSEGKGVYEWTYHGILAWSLFAPGSKAPYGAGWFDVDSGRRFRGGVEGGFAPEKLRSVILRAITDALPPRLQNAPNKARYMEANPQFPEPLPPVSVPVKGKVGGTCSKYVASDKALELASSLAENLSRGVIGHPALAGAQGPWEGSLFLCSQGSPEIRLRLRGAKLDATAQCIVEEPLVFSEPEGILAQCLTSMATDLEQKLITAYQSR